AEFILSVAEPDLPAELHDAAVEVVFDDAGAAADLPGGIRRALLEARRVALDTGVGDAAVHHLGAGGVGEQFGLAGADLHGLLEQPAAARGPHIPGLGLTGLDGLVALRHA